MNIGLYFGSFNPIHTGHLFIANHMAHHTDLDEVWFVVSPQNPFKDKKSLLREYDRLHLVNLAIEDNYKLRSSKIEFDLPKPSYTIDTLVHIEEKFPQHQFALIMGGDNLPSLHKWKNSEQIKANYTIYVYNRPGTEIATDLLNDKIILLDSPQVYLSSSYIRKQLKEGKSIKYLVPEKVENYVLDMNLYK